MHSMDKKFLIFIVIITMVIVGGAIALVGPSSTNTKATVSKTTGAKISIDHNFKTVGNIGYSNGILYHSFPIKNTGTKDLEIANMVSSCMCTKVFLKAEGKNGPEFGMKGMSAPSSWKGILKPGEKGEIIAAFDPTYHGPQGIGPVSRTASFETNDPNNPYVELSFEGTVTK